MSQYPLTEKQLEQIEALLEIANRLDCDACPGRRIYPQFLYSYLKSRGYNMIRTDTPTQVCWSIIATHTGGLRGILVEDPNRDYESIVFLTVRLLNVKEKEESCPNFI